MKRLKRKKQKQNNKNIVKNSILKVVVLLVIIGLNWSGLLAIVQTLASFQDTEISPENTYNAATLDFSIPTVPDFVPNIPPTQNSFRTINIQNNGVLDFNYKVRVESASGALCAYLELEDDLSSNAQPLNSFVSATTTFSNKSSWYFTATLKNYSPSLQNQSCNFTFVFEGSNGFSDIEKITNTITSVTWYPEVTVTKPNGGGVWYMVPDSWVASVGCEN